MTFIDLPETITLPPSQARHNLAITSIVIYAIILPVTWLIEYPVIWKNWSSKRRRRNCFRVSFEVFFDFISLLCMIRIIGNALYLSSSTPSRSVFIVQTLFTSLGFLPMLMKLIFVITRIINKSEDPSPFHTLKWALVAVRVTLVIGVIVIIVGACILMLDLWKAGATVLVAVFFALASIHIGLLIYNKRNGLLISAAALLPLAVRAAYLVLIQYSQTADLNPITGNVGYLIGMGYVMEYLVIIALLAATVVSEELFWFKNNACDSETGERLGSEEDKAFSSV